MKSPNRQRQRKCVLFMWFPSSTLLLLFKSIHSNPAFCQFNYFGTQCSGRKELRSLSPRALHHLTSPPDPAAPQIPSLTFPWPLTVFPHRGCSTWTNAQIQAAPANRCDVLWFWALSEPDCDTRMRVPRRAHAAGFNQTRSLAYRRHNTLWLGS